jgi:hypothetical protein
MKSTSFLKKFLKSRLDSDNGIDKLLTEMETAKHA